MSASLTGRAGLGSVELFPVPNFVLGFVLDNQKIMTQEISVKCLLCARHCLGGEGVSMRDTEKIPSLVEFTV